VIVVWRLLLHHHIDQFHVKLGQTHSAISSTADEVSMPIQNEFAVRSRIWITHTFGSKVQPHELAEVHIFLRHDDNQSRISRSLKLVSCECRGVRPNEQ